MPKSTMTMPLIDPRLGNPRAVAYRNALEARKSTQPVAGGPTPPIPDLTQSPPEGELPKPMSAHATQAREQRVNTAANIADLLNNPNSIIRNTPVSPNGAPSQPSLQAGDILPEEAMKDPQFQGGMGSVYAANQPHLAMKYGVLRKGVHIPPQALRSSQPQGKGLSPATIEGLEKVAEFQEKRMKAEQRSVSDVAAEKAVTHDMHTSQRGAGREASQQVDRKKIAEDVASKLDDFDFDSFRQAMTKDMLNNPEQRKIIEARLEPMSIEDLIIDGCVRQMVPVVPGKFWLTFCSTSPEEDLAIKRLIMQEARTVQINENYYLDKFAFMALTLGLERINNNPLPSHRGADGRFNEELFWKKFDFICGLNLHLIASAGVNHSWFDQRVRALFVAENIKNG